MTVTTSNMDSFPDPASFINCNELKRLKLRSRTSSNFVKLLLVNVAVVILSSAKYKINFNN